VCCTDILDEALTEEPDPAQFFALMQKRQVSQQAMEAQLKLHEKGKKAAMNEAK
jgi:hypothetical protein